MTIPAVRSRQETGAMGYLAGIGSGRYTKATRRKWARMGGRKPNRTLAEIQAANESTARSATRRRA